MADDGNPMERPKKSSDTAAKKRPASSASSAWVQCKGCGVAKTVVDYSDTKWMEEEKEQLCLVCEPTPMASPLPLKSQPRKRQRKARAKNKKNMEAAGAGGDSDEDEMVRSLELQVLQLRRELVVFSF